MLADRHRSKGIVFFCWGNWAKKMLESAKIDKKKHLILSSVHPSPLSASRGFFNTGHFKQADEWIKERYGKGIDWMVQSADRVDKQDTTQEPATKKPKKANEVDDAVNDTINRDKEENKAEEDIDKDAIEVKDVQDIKSQK